MSKNSIKNPLVFKGRHKIKNKSKIMLKKINNNNSYFIVSCVVNRLVIRMYIRVIKNINKIKINLYKITIIN
mgnify:CR=1 FL=1